MSTMPVYAAVTRYGSHRPKHRRNIASRVLDRSATRIALHSHAYGMLLCSEAPELHTHTREEARGAARETDACRARCAESRGRGTRSFTLLDPRLLVVVWTLESAWRRDRVREVITRQTGRSSGPAPARCGRRPWRCRSDAGRVAAAASDRARRAQRAPRQRQRESHSQAAQGREAVPVAPRCETVCELDWSCARGTPDARRDAQRDAGRKSGLPPLLRGTAP